MNQEKIGKFIQELRKEKNMTQKDLAEKLNVSINAVSKWERGICLMDVSIMKPLSQLLKISIAELINGERNGNDDINLKTSDAIEKTLKYSNKKIKKIKKNSKLIVISIIIGLLLVGYFGYKAFLITVFDPLKYRDEETTKIYNQFLEALNNQDKMTIEHYKISEEDYLDVGLKIRNDFKDYQEDIFLDGNTIVYYQLDDNNERKSTFEIGAEKNYISLFTKSSNYITISSFYDSDLDLVSSYQLEEFLEDNNINNDVDLLNFIKDRPYIKNNIFTNIDKIKKNISYNLFVDIVCQPIEKITLIDGDCTGYMFTMATNNNFKVVNILKNDIKYTLTFMGDNFTDDYINELLNTLVIW